MIFAPHTLELRLTLDTKKFKNLKDKAYKNAKGKNYRVHPDKKNRNIHVDHALKDKGITIKYQDDRYKKKIRLIVNPTEVLGGDDVKKLWRPNKDNIYKLLRKLDKYIDDYFESKYKMNDFRLARIDFTINIDVGDKKTVTAYIKILQKIGKVKLFSPKFNREEKANEAFNDADSFDLEGNSNDIGFSIYDKAAQLRHKKDERHTLATGILRIEVRINKSKAISKLTKETITAKQIMDLTLNSKEIFLATFIHIVPYGDYYKKKQAIKIVEDNVSKKKLKDKMIKLIELIPKRKSLLLAQKELKSRNLSKILLQFARLNVSPVTIPKSVNKKHLDGLYKYLKIDI